MRNESAYATAVVLPWIFAVAGFLFGAAMLLRGPAPGTKSADSSVEPKEASALRAALASANATNDSLRRELDRLRTGRPSQSMGAGGAGATAGGSDGSSPKGPTADQQEIGKRLKDALARAAGGDSAARAEAAKEVWALLNSGPGSAATLRDAYLATGDSLGKSLVLGSMIFGNSPEARDFVLDQVQSEKDPQLRGVLIRQAAKYATSADAGVLESTFIQSIDSSDDQQTRIAAIRGLRYAPGNDAPEALTRAASDPSEDVRIAAMDIIGSRADGARTLEMLMSKDPSPRVREYAQCRMLVAKEAR